MSVRRPPTVTSRVAVLGGVAVVVFAVLLFRLWVLQILQADAFARAGERNGVRTALIQARRGEILSADGGQLAIVQPNDAVTIDLAQWPLVARRCRRGAVDRPAPIGPDLAEVDRRVRRIRNRALRGLRGAARARRLSAIEAATRRSAPRPWAGCTRGAEGKVVRELAAVAGIDLRVLEDRLHRAVVRAPFEPATVLEDAPRELVFYLKENGAKFPSVRVVKRTKRVYPHGALAAHVFGELGEISAAELTDADRFPGANAGDLVGRSGLEGIYDRWLRGIDGQLSIVVNAKGEPQGPIRVTKTPTPGANLHVTIDLRIQEAAEQALKAGIDVAHATGHEKAVAAAVVVLDPKNGAIKAIVSMPEFNPNQLYGEDAAANRARLNRLDNPFLNRATTGRYPPGSTFKPATAIAAAAIGQMTPNRRLKCDAGMLVDGQLFRNFESDVNEDMDLTTALTQSCDTFFYRLGLALYAPTQKSFEPQPTWARRLGFGQLTGIDLPSDAGRVPDAAFKKERWKDAPAKIRAIGEKWTSGDAVQMAIGQGDLEATPLQIARLYALIANGGTLVTPHIAERVESPAANFSFTFAPKGRVQIDPELLDAIRAGLLGVTHDKQGTAHTAFSGFPVSVAGKTGTAEKRSQRDYSWFAGYAPADDPELVAVALIEQGGRGGDAAARVVREVFASAFNARTSADVISSPTRLDGSPITPDLVQIANAEVFGDPTSPDFVYPKTDDLKGQNSSDGGYSVVNTGT